jgi:hypothetical protein
MEFKPSGLEVNKMFFQNTFEACNNIYETIVEDI